MNMATEVKAIIEDMEAAYCSDEIGRADVKTAGEIIAAAEDSTPEVLKKACKILLYDSIVKLYRAGEQLQPTAGSMAEGRYKLSEILRGFARVTDRLLIEDITETERERSEAASSDPGTLFNAYRSLLAVSLSKLLRICGQLEPTQESISAGRHSAGDVLAALSCMTGQYVIEEAA